jgi:hypothetical protein
MKALAIRQPWATLIARGYKDIENRTWRTSFRGRFLVHASLKFDHEGYAWVQSEIGLSLPAPSSYPRGGIIGSVELVDVVEESASPWFMGPHGFMLSEARQHEFYPMKGMLGFFEVVAL